MQSLDYGVHDCVLYREQLKNLGKLVRLSEKFNRLFLTYLLIVESGDNWGTMVNFCDDRRACWFGSFYNQMGNTDFDYLSIFGNI